MNEIGNKRLYKHLTEPVINKKAPIKQIIIKKIVTKNNNGLQNENNENNNSKILGKSILNKSAILNRIENEEIPNSKNIHLDFFNSTGFTKNQETKIKYMNRFNTTIIKPAIVQQSFLKPIIMPVNIQSSGNLENDLFFQIMNNSSYTNNAPKNLQIQKNDKIYKKKNINCTNDFINKKENINPNTLGNSIKRKAIIQKNIKNRNNKINKDKEKVKDILLINPQPKNKDNLIIHKMGKNNNLKLKIENRIKFKTLQPKIKEEKIINGTTKDEIKNNVVKKEEKQKNDLRKSMKPIETINNITVNNTLKQTFKEMIKCKTIVVGLNNQIGNNKEFGPRDSIRFKNN